MIKKKKMRSRKTIYLACQRAKIIRTHKVSLTYLTKIVATAANYTNRLLSRLGIRPLVYEYNCKVANHIRLDS